jgi:hypothetical protein
LDLLVVGHQDLLNKACDMRCHGGDVAAGIGIVGALDKAADVPPVAAVSDTTRDDGDGEAGDRQMFAAELPPAFYPRGGCRSFQRDAVHDSLRRQKLCPPPG